MQKTHRRLILWSLPCVLAVLGLAALRHSRDSARLSEASSLLVQGEAQSAGRILAELSDSWLHGARARAGLRIAAALGARPDVPVAAAARLDTSPFPLAVLARRAFERGQFAAVLELIELAEEVGRPTVSLVKIAALIEQGRHRELGQELEAMAVPEARQWPQADVRLARHIHHYAETYFATSHSAGPATQTMPDDSSLILRDRTGHRLGYLDADGELTPVDGIRPEWIPRAVVEAVAEHRGAVSLRLSLDLEISALAFKAFGSYRGSIVILDPRSGQILAAVSDARTLRTGDGTPAFEERREPASIAKLITTTAALRAGVDPDAEIARMTCNGHRVYNGEYLYCPYIARRLRGLDHALAVSCNLAFADLGVQVGRRRMLEEHRRYGFDTLDSPFPGGRIVVPQGNDRQLADLSIGLEATEITPLHAALLAAVMANDGVMPVPTLVHAEDGRLGFHPRRLSPPPGRRVVEPEWLPMLLSAMEEVAERGTANHIAPFNFPVAMKTGTASHPRYGFHVNYIGIGPMPEARLAFSVRITHQRTSRNVRYAARRVTQRLLRDLGRMAEQRGWLDDTDHVPGRDRIHRLAYKAPPEEDMAAPLPAR